MTVDQGQETPCRTGDPDEWFPEGNQPDRWAQKLCQGCPLLHPCGEWALRRDEHGVWGGMTRHQRLRIQRQRPVVPAQRTEPRSPGAVVPVKALALLAESERLRTDEQMTMPEIAARLGISGPYLKEARARARRYLAEVAA